MVRCPECGTICDVASLITRRWTEPWWRAPGFNVIVLPACWAFVAWMGMAATFGLQIAVSGGVASAEVALAANVTILVIWVWLVVRAWRRFGDWRAAALAMLAHLILVGYIAGVWGVIGGVIACIGGLLEGEIQAALIAGFIAGLCGIVVAVSRRGERFIASHCIRQYLKGATDLDLR